MFLFWIVYSKSSKEMCVCELASSLKYSAQEEHIGGYGIKA